MRSRGIESHRVGIESLETRRLLSVSVVAKKLALTIIGTAGDDVITVAASRNLINVLSVTIANAGGTEEKLVSVGRFKTIGISAGAGNDTIRIESTLSGLTGDVGVWIDTGAGDDNLAACSLGGTIKLGAGNDRATPSATDRLYVSGEAGNDKITLPKGTHWADGGAGNDTIVAGNGKQIINGGSGNDELIASSTSGTINGDAGDDHVTISNVGIYDSNAKTTVFGGDGNDRIEGDADQMHGGAGNDILITGDRIAKLFGNEGNDVLDARAGYGSTLHGNQGDDDLYGVNYTAAYGDSGADWFQPDVIFSPNDFDPKEDRARGSKPNTPSYGGSSSGSISVSNGGLAHLAAIVLTRLDDVGYVVNLGITGEKTRFVGYGTSRPLSRPTLTKDERKVVRNGIVRLPTGWSLSNEKISGGFTWYDVKFGKGGDRANSTEFSTVYALAVKQGTVVVTQDGGYAKGALRIGRARSDVAAMWLPANATARIAGDESTTYTIAGDAPTSAIKAPARQRGIAVDGGVIWLPFEDKTTRFAALA